MSVNNYTRALVSNQWDITPATLQEALKTVFPGRAAQFHIVASGTTLTVTATPDLSGPDVVLLDAEVASLEAAFTPVLAKDEPPSGGIAYDFVQYTTTDSGPVVIGTQYMLAGVITLANSRMWMGAQAATGVAKVELVRKTDAAVVATWQSELVPGGQQLTLDATLPADDYYELRLERTGDADTAVFEGASLRVI